VRGAEAAHEEGVGGPAEPGNGQDPKAAAVQDVWQPVLLQDVM